MGHLLGRCHWLEHLPRKAEDHHQTRHLVRKLPHETSRCDRLRWLGQADCRPLRPAHDPTIVRKDPWECHAVQSSWDCCRFVVESPRVKYPVVILQWGKKVEVRSDEGGDLEQKVR